MNLQTRFGISIWFIPSKETTTKLTTIISKLSKKYSSPLFEPHITLSKHIKITDKIVDIFKNNFKELKEFEMEVINVDQDNKYFKCLFLSLKISEEFKEAIKISEKLFKGEQPEVNPHLSLIYGNMPENERKELVISLSKELKDIKKIKIKKVKLYITKGSVYTWKELASISLIKK
ncbi:MAG: hypothetical protein QXD23_00685 [Candidatus Micrarchaeaceae archaeon]